MFEIYKFSHVGSCVERHFKKELSRNKNNFDEVDE